MGNKIVLGIGVFVSVILLTAIIVYYNLTVVKVDFINQSKFPINKVEIWAAGEIRWQGTLLPEETVSKRFFPKQDGYIVVKGLWNNKAIESSRFGYLTHNLGGQHEVILKSDGAFEYKHTSQLASS